MNLYDFSVYYLTEHTEGLTQSVLDKYFKVYKVSSLDEAFERGVASVNDNNKRTMANAIAYFRPERKAVISKVLCDFKLESFRKKYGNDVDRLFNDLCSQCVPDSKQSTDDAWHKFAKNIITLAEYLSCFKNIDELYKVFENADSVKEKIRLVNTVSERVAQWGFTMASNWIKDMGMTGYCKPDQHVRAIIDGIYQTTVNEKAVFIKVIEVAEQCNISPFELDRLLFLIGSGDFYGKGHENIKKSYRGNEQDFIDLFKSQM